MSDPKRPYCGDPLKTTTTNCSGGEKVKALKNVTTIKDEAGADVAPFARKEYADVCNFIALDCIPDGGGSGSDHCASVISNADVKAELPADSLPLVSLGNTFQGTTPPTKLDAGFCPKYGMKSTQAVKAWHGAFPFTHDANGIHCEFPWKKWNSGTHSYDLHATDIGGCVPNRTDTKYLKVTWNTYLGVYDNYGTNDGILFDSSTGVFSPYPSYNAGLDPDGHDNTFRAVLSTADGNNQVGRKTGVVSFSVEKKDQYNLNSDSAGGWFANTHDAGYPLSKNGILVNNSGAPCKNDGTAISGADVTIAQDTVNSPYLSASVYVGFPACTNPPWLNSIADSSVDSEEYYEINSDVGGYPAGYISLNPAGKIAGAPSFNAADWPDGTKLCYYKRTVTRVGDTYTFSEVLFAMLKNTGSIWADQLCHYQGGTITLSNPYHIGDDNPVATDPNVLRDAALALASWRLRDKREAGEVIPAGYTASYLDHPWRSDENAFIAPLVCYNENTATSPQNYHAKYLAGVPLVAGLPQEYIDPNAAIYDGTIIGKPLPQGYGLLPNAEGKTGSYDFFFWRWARDFCTDHWADSNMEYGMWTPSFLPRNCQRWTRHYHIPYYWFGNLGVIPPRVYPASFVKADKDGIFLQKMVETIIEKPSYDFTRPHTQDRFLLDQPADPESLSKIYYVSSVVANAVTLALRDGTAATDVTGDFTAGDIVGPCTIGGVAGFYAVSAVVGPVVTVGALKWLVPTGFTNDSRDADRAFGKIRYPDAPGFSGKLTVTAADASGDTVLTYSAQPCIQTGDLVDLWNGTAWDDNGGAGYTLTRLTDTTAQISGSHLDTIAIVPHAYAVIDPATGNPLSGQKWYFADSAPKGDFVNRQWTINLDSGEQEPDTIAANQYCLPKKPCGPRVTGFSPQYVDPETGLPAEGYNEGDAEFINGRIVAFPLTVHHGNLWQGESEPWMVDPLWQVPHKPGKDGTDYANLRWHQDNGTCQEDYTDPDNPDIYHMFYRLPDFYESRLTPPSNYGLAHDETAPTPPAPVNLAADQTPPATVNLPLVAGYWDEIIPTVVKPWGIYYRQQSCVCASGRFYEAYRANKVVC